MATPYCTSTDLTDAGIAPKTVIELTDEEGTASTATTIADAIVLNSAIEDRIDAAIAQADAEINSWVQKQYAVDIAATVPQRIKTLSIDLSIYYLHKRRRSELGVPEAIRMDYKDALATLKEINQGRIDLGVQPAPAASDQVVAEYDGEDQVFTADTMKDF